MCQHENCGTGCSATFITHSQGKTGRSALLWLACYFVRQISLSTRMQCQECWHIHTACKLHLQSRAYNCNGQQVATNGATMGQQALSSGAPINECLPRVLGCQH